MSLHPSSPASLPSRPDLDHLRRQAKHLLAALQARDPEAAAVCIAHLPAAASRTPEQVFEAGYRLADAQSAVARRLGFAGWPALARHVAQLRALEGDWRFVSLEVDGQAVPATMLGASRILIDGDRFRTESPEATYDGEFLIDVEADPHTIDIHFVEGPEAGQQSLGIFRLDGETVTFCLGLTGAARPARFATSPGTRHALETLRRHASTRPVGVTGGDATHAASTTAQAAAVPHAHGSAGAFPASACALDAQVAGTWVPVALVRDGVPMPAAWLSAGRRIVQDGIVEVRFGGQRMVHARIRHDDAHAPAHVDYLHLSGDAQGQVTLGICAYDGTEVRVNMAPPGAPRPTDWESAPGSGRSFSRWTRSG